MDGMSMSEISTREIQYPALHDLADWLHIGEVGKLSLFQRQELLGIVRSYEQANGYKARWVSEYKDVPQYKAARRAMGA